MKNLVDVADDHHEITHDQSNRSLTQGLMITSMTQMEDITSKQADKARSSLRAGFQLAGANVKRVVPVDEIVVNKLDANPLNIRHRLGRESRASLNA